MAISKVIFNGDTLMDVTGDNPATDNMLTGTRATGADGVTVNGAVVTAPASTADPEMDGTADPGSESTYSRGDHVHPTDTTRQAKITASGILKGDGSGGVSAAVAGTDYIASHQDISGKLDKSGGTMTGALTLSGAPTSNLHAATKKYVDDSVPSVPSATSTSPKMDGTAAVGSETAWAKGDHVHPTDTSRAPTSHASSATTYGTGTSSNYGHLKLSDSTSSTSSTSGGIAATPAAVKAAYDLANGKQSPATTLAGYGITDAATADELGTFVRPNLLDNWYFVGGGQFPINQRGNTSYSAGAYCIDRWYNRQNITASLVSNGLKLELSNTGGYPFFTQRLENYQDYLGKTVTVSVMIAAVSANFKGVRLDIDASNGVSTNSYTWPATSTFYTTPGVYSVTVTLPDTIEYSGLNMSLYFGAASRAIGDYCVISAVKLELGSIQTLAHWNETTQAWVLNEKPNYQQELARCQRYFLRLNALNGSTTHFALAMGESTTSANAIVSLPVTMRAVPSASFSGTANLRAGTTDYAVTSVSTNNHSENAVYLNLKVSSGLSAGSLYAVRVASGYIDLTADL